VQAAIVPFITVNGIYPDLLIIFLVYLSLRKGQVFGTVSGFVIGFFFDIFTGGMLGAAMFSKTLAGFTAGYFFNENKVQYNLNSYLFVLIVLFCGALDSMFYQILISKNIEINFPVLFFKQSILPAAYTSIISLIWIIFKPKREAHA